VVDTEDEPSDAETLDSESSGDESEETDDVDTDTEQTTESEEQVVPKSERVSFCGESASENGTANKVTTSNASVTKSVVNTYSRLTEHGQKIDLLLYGRLLKQAAAKTAKSEASGVVHSDQLVAAKPVSVQWSSASVETILPQSVRVNSSSSGLRSAGTSVGNYFVDCFWKPGVVSRQRDSGISAVCGPKMKSSVSQTNSARLTAAPTSAARRIVPTLCGRVDMSASTANDPAVTAVVKDEPAEDVMNQTYSVADAGGGQLQEQLHSETFFLPSDSKQCKSNCSVTAARPNVSETLVVTDVDKHCQLVDSKMPFNETFVTASLVKPITNMKPVSGQYNVIHAAFNKPCQLSSCNSANEASLQRWRAMPHLPREAAMKASCVSTACPRPADTDEWHGRSTCTTKHKDVEPLRRERTALTPRQRVASKAFLDRRPVITSVSADSCHLPDVEKRDRSNARCLNQTADVSTSELVLCKMPGSAKAVKRASQFLPDRSTFLVEERAVSAVFDSNPLSTKNWSAAKSTPRGDQSESLSTCSGHSVPSSSATFEVRGHKARPADVADWCFNHTNNSDVQCAYTSDVGRKNVTSDNRFAGKTSRRRCRGFAASTPLRDDSPPPCDVSFGSLSSISVASDWEHNDASDESEGDFMLPADDTDEVMLLDVSFTSDESLNVAFVSDDRPPSMQSAASADVVSVTPHRTDTACTTHGEVSCQLLSSAKSSERRPSSTKNCSAYCSNRVPSSPDSVNAGRRELSNDAGPLVRELRSRRTRQETASSDSIITVTSHETDSEATGCQKSLKFQPVSASSRRTTRLTTVSNAQNQERDCKLSNESSRPVVSQLCSKRTRVMSWSFDDDDDDDDDATFIRHNSRSLRNTRARLA